MDVTTIKCYISQDGKDLIRIWYESQDDDVQANFVAALELISSRARHQWPSGQCKQLDDRPESKCDGLYEILMGVRGRPHRHYRIIGFCGPQDFEFSMLYPFQKDDDASYGEPCRIAQKRKVAVKQNWKHSHVCQFP